MRSTMAKHLGLRNTALIMPICHWSNSGFMVCNQAQRAVASKHPQRGKAAYLPSQGHASSYRCGVPHNLATLAVDGDALHR